MMPVENLKTLDLQEERVMSELHSFSRSIGLRSIRRRNIRDGGTFKNFEICQT